MDLRARVIYIAVMSPNRPTSLEHASFDELPPPSTASVHPPGPPPLARAC
ncbi:BQ5605_C003g01961 [Microbotryum silenes-dioicae]|uniref:BQ5605_C003g01961 protein n=1 Tax=Microbotryum silenes-dioicae TaxID=796604 RepID=A0A2X0P345_9BASI|nr:BQ5605_C003g01961 [Microbotryum silenes-dioicae]